MKTEKENIELQANRRKNIKKHGEKMHEEKQQAINLLLFKILVISVKLEAWKGLPYTQKSFVYRKTSTKR